MGVAFRAIPSNFNEQLDDARDPEAVAKELGLAKALDIAELYPEAIVIGSDTIVCVDGRQLAKPRDIAEAREMLALLNGKTHQVVTSAVVVCKAAGAQFIGADTTNVTFKQLDENTIDAYVDTGDPMDKAGGYGIQSGAAHLIDHIEGNYDTVVGFPTQLVASYLAEFHIPTKPVLLQCPVPVQPKAGGLRAA